MTRALVPLSAAALLSFFVACTPAEIKVGEDSGAPIEETDPSETDADGDGYTADIDCDDENPDVNPGASEGGEANGDDEDCDGTADNVVVCDDDLADFGSIQEAIEEAPDGFIIQVCAGTYEENLSIDGKSLAIVALEGADQTILDGGGAGPTVSVRDTGRDGAGVQGFTIRGGVGALGGGVSCSDATLGLADNIIIENSATTGGGGVGADDCAVAMGNNLIVANGAEAGLGGGVYLLNCDGEVVGNQVNENTAMEGGGVFVWEGNVTLANNEVLSNQALTIDEEIRDAGGGGGGIWASGRTELTGNVVRENTSQYNGGGVFLHHPTGDISGNEVGNNVSIEDGAGIYVSRGTSRIFDNSIIDNTANDDGGGLRVYVGRLTIEDNLMQGNSAGDDGGGSKMSHSTNVFRNNTLIGNSAGDAGGGLELDNETADVHGCIFEGNTATRGAGLHSWRNEGSHTLYDNLFLQNVAGDCGGGISFDNDPYLLTVEHSTFIENEANDGAALCIDLVYREVEEGEEPWYEESNIRVRNVVIAENEASDDGGVAYVKGGDMAIVNASTFNNDGLSINAFAVKEDGHLSVTNTIVSGNDDGEFILVEDNGEFTARYNNFNNNDGGYVGTSDPVGSQGNIDVEPGFSDATGRDFTLESSSACVDAGDPSVSDTDGSRSDMGAYGGPQGSW